jgi:Domain of unknown function (DUF1902)
MRKHFDVKVTWDPEAKMWVADSDDVPGLAAEAPDPDSLVKKLSVLVPELLELNHVPVVPKAQVELVLHYLLKQAGITGERID